MLVCTCYPLSVEPLLHCTLSYSSILLFHFVEFTVLSILPLRTLSPSHICPLVEGCVGSVVSWPTHSCPPSWGAGLGQLTPLVLGAPLTLCARGHIHALSFSRG